MSSSIYIYIYIYWSEGGTQSPPNGTSFRRGRPPARVCQCWTDPASGGLRCAWRRTMSRLLCGTLFASGAVILRKDAISLRIPGPRGTLIPNYDFLCQMHFGRFLDSILGFIVDSPQPDFDIIPRILCAFPGFPDFLEMKISTSMKKYVNLRNEYFTTIFISLHIFSYESKFLISDKSLAL